MYSLKRYIIPLTIFFLLGIFGTLLTKLLLETKANGLKQYGEHKFQKPVFIAALGFFGMPFSIIVYCICTYFDYINYPNILEVITKELFFMFSIPAFFDVFQCIVSMVAIDHVGIPIDCMMKSATLIGVTLITRFYFGQVIPKYKLFALSIITLSLIIVGTSSIINSGKSHTIQGGKGLNSIIIIVKIITQLLYAIKISFDEYIIQKKKLHALIITGIEGIWTTIFSIISLFIFNYIPGILHEDFNDTIEMIKNSTLISVMVVIFFLICSIYAFNSFTLLSKTSAIIRLLADLFRTFIIWIIQLILYYSFLNSANLSHLKEIGEEWVAGSYIELFGFLLLTFGIIQHYGYPKLSYFRYDGDISSDQGFNDKLLPEFQKINNEYPNETQEETDQLANENDNIEL